MEKKTHGTRRHRDGRREHRERKEETSDSIPPRSRSNESASTEKKKELHRAKSKGRKQRRRKIDESQAQQSLSSHSIKKQASQEEAKRPILRSHSSMSTSSAGSFRGRTPILEEPGSSQHDVIVNIPFEQHSNRRKPSQNPPTRPPAPAVASKHMYPTSKQSLIAQFCCCFCIRGFMANSFFAKQLGFITFIMVMLESIALASYYLQRYNIVDISLQEDSVGCQNLMLFSTIAYHGASVSILLGLPSTGFQIFDLFNRPRLENQQHRRKLKRTLFLQFCEVIVVLLILFQMGLFLSFIFTFAQQVFRCKDMEIVIFSGASVVVFVLTFVQIVKFTRFREHLKMQLGVFREKDQTGNIRGRYRSKKKRQAKGCFSIQSLVIADVRRRIYKAVELRDIREMQTILLDAKSLLGDDFAEIIFKPPRLWFGIFATSVKNPMLLAASTGDIMILEILYANGFDVNAFDKFIRVRFSTADLFWYFARYIVSRQTADAKSSTSIFRSTLLTPLHCACLSGRHDAVKWLIAHGANVHAVARSSTRSERVPPLFMTDSPDTAQELLLAGANHLVVPDPGNLNTLTVLENAYIKGHFALARVLEEWGADVALTPMHAAAGINDTDEIERLLRRNVDPNCLGEHGYVGMNQRTPLHWAANMGARESVALLLQHGADPNFADKTGRTPLHWAARHNHLDIVKMLLKNGSNPNAQDKLEINPLICAAAATNVSKEVFLSLMSRGADINYQLPNGDSALHVAMKFESRNTALALLECGADIMLTNHSGYRPVDCSTSTELQFAVKKAAGNRDVMISYTHSHMEFAIKLRESLENANVTTWLDLMSPTGIGGGSVWREEIARGISNAAVVLCLVSEDYMKSEWCLKELAYAKQVGTPVVGISLENVKITEELQVYLYTRQLIPFEPAITAINKRNLKKIVYQYDDSKYATQFRLLLDGVRDEIEKRRQAGIVGLPRTKEDDASDLIIESAESLDHEKRKYVFLSHGNCHGQFVQKLYDEFTKSGIVCVLDKSGAHTEQAILKCSCFVVVLSDKTSTNELVSDQLAYAEDKGKPIYPILLSQPVLSMGHQYTLSRNEIFHFTMKLGFMASFTTLTKSLNKGMYPKRQRYLELLRGKGRQRGFSVYNDENNDDDNDSDGGRDDDRDTQQYQHQSIYFDDRPSVSSMAPTHASRGSFLSTLCSNNSYRPSNLSEAYSEIHGSSPKSVGSSPDHVRM